MSQRLIRVSLEVKVMASRLVRHYVSKIFRAECNNLRFD